MPGRAAAVRYLPCAREDLFALQRLADEALGTGYVDGDRFDPGTVLVARSEGRLAGFVHFEPADSGLSLKTIVVDAEFRFLGIGSALAHAALSRHPCARWTSPAWIDRDRIPADALLRALGFVPEHLAPDYWLADSLERNYLCPSCGHPCHCSAMIYVRTAPSETP